MNARTENRVFSEKYRNFKYLFCTTPIKTEPFNKTTDLVSQVSRISFISHYLQSGWLLITAHDDACCVYSKTDKNIFKPTDKRDTYNCNYPLIVQLLTQIYFVASKRACEQLAVRAICRWIAGITLDYTELWDYKVLCILTEDRIQWKCSDTWQKVNGGFFVQQFPRIELISVTTFWIEVYNHNEFFVASPYIYLPIFWNLREICLYSTVTYASAIEEEMAFFASLHPYI